MLPRWENSQPVLHAAHGTGNWIGAASALIHDDYIYLAYRDRHPVEQGRGNRAYVARSPLDNGIHFDTLCAIDKDDMDAESLERPALDVTPDGDWDLYLSCATYSSRHWRIERLRARRPQDFSARTRATVFPGSAAFGIKDPVLVRGEDLRIFATLHPMPFTSAWSADGACGGGAGCGAGQVDGGHPGGVLLGDQGRRLRPQHRPGGRPGPGDGGLGFLQACFRA